MVTEEVLRGTQCRDPFLFVDEIREKGVKYIIATKTFTRDEYFFKGHFPALSIMPGALICEAIFQTGSILIKNDCQREGVAVIVKIRKIKFKNVFFPPGKLLISCEITDQIDLQYHMSGKVASDGIVIATIDYTMTWIDADKQKLIYLNLKNKKKGMRDQSHPCENSKAIIRKNPATDPFSFVDDIMAVEENKLVARKSITGNELYFRGHIPCYPIFPGCLILESLFQAGGLFAIEKYGQKALPIVTRVHNVRFKDFVIPPAQVDITAELLDAIGGCFRFKGLASVDGIQVVTAEYLILFRDRKILGESS